MPKVNFKLMSNFESLLQKWKDGLKTVSAKTIQATFNEIVKYTLPSSPTNDEDFNKTSASKSAPKIKANIKALRTRIKRDILGSVTKTNKKGNTVETWSGKSGIPSGIPANENGIIARGTKRGMITAGYIVLRQSKSKKAKKVIQPVNFTSSPQELIKHIIKATVYYKRGGKVAKRIKRKGSRIMWIDKAETAIEAANIMSKNAGVLLSGWRALQERILQMKGLKQAKSNLLNNVLVGTNPNKKKGQGSIKQTEEEIHLKATNENVDKSVQRYQQQVIDKNLEKNLNKHYKNEVKYLNEQIKREMENNTKLKVTK